MQGIHDTYAKANNIPFHLGETGTTSSDSQKAQWIETLTSEDTCNKLSHFEGERTDLDSSLIGAQSFFPSIPLVQL